MSSKYKYEGIPLDVYCKEHRLNINNQRTRVKNYINEYPKLSEDEAVKLAIDKCGIRYCKYIYKEQSLSKWCADNSKDYSSMVDRVLKIKETNN